MLSKAIRRVMNKTPSLGRLPLVFVPKANFDLVETVERLETGTKL
jgi:hypothetical protein